MSPLGYLVGSFCCLGSVVVTSETFSSMSIIVSSSFTRACVRTSVFFRCVKSALSMLFLCGPLAELLGFLQYILWFNFVKEVSMFRRPVNKASSAHKFRNNIRRTKGANVSPPPARGGYRL